MSPFHCRLAAGCGTTNRYDGHTYQDVLLAARHVMDQYSVANVVGIEELLPGKFLS